LDREQKKSKLKKIRFYRRRVVLLFLMWLPYGALMMALFKLFSIDEKYFSLPMISYMVFFAYCSIVMSFAKCPECGKRFFTKELFGPLFAYHNPFSGKCLNCGLILNPEKEKNA